MLRRLLVCLFLMLPTAVQAEWREAHSQSFIVYSEGDPDRLREFAVKLEKFDRVLRLFHNVQAEPSPNKLRVFLLADIAAVARMAGAPSSTVAGYYVPESRAMMLVGTRSQSTRRALDSEAILLHEYTHHFMHHYFPATYPTWYSEGYAEFWGTTQIRGDTVEVGHPAEHRFASINPGSVGVTLSRWLPVDRLLTARSYRDVPELDLLYAEGWLLVRYVWQNAERRRQLQQYLTLINQGTSYQEAMNQAFGANARSLNDELYDYAGTARFDVIRLPFRDLDPGHIEIRTLDRVEQALIEYEIRLSQGVPHARFAAFAADLRRAASPYPDHPHALRLLAEVERIAGNAEAASAAADRLLALAPDDPRGLMHKAMIEVEALRRAGSQDAAAWENARQRIRRAQRLRPSDPLLLEALHDSYTAQGRLPPEDAQNALYDALDLAPGDAGLRHKLAADFEHRGMVPEAIAIIRPHAYRLGSHEEESDRDRARREAVEERQRRAGDTRRESPREMLDRLEARLREPGGAG